MGERSLSIIKWKEGYPTCVRTLILVDERRSLWLGFFKLVLTRTPAAGRHVLRTLSRGLSALPHFSKSIPQMGQMIFEKL